MPQRNSLLAGFFGLARNTNKAGGRTDDEATEGVTGELLPELTLTTPNEDLITLSDTWEKAWNDSDVKTQWVKMGDENENYWKGKQFEKIQADDRRSLMDNVIFEGLETYIPQVTQQPPDPLVELAAEEDKDSQGNQEFVLALQHELGDLAGELEMRLKMQSAARHKELYLLGVAKFAWDLDNDIPSMKILRPRKILLDPEATVDEDGYTGKRIGEMRKETAARLIELTANEENADETKKYIEEKVNNEMATEIVFIEWWTPDYYFWKLEDKILKKSRNPHWNYDQQQPIAQGPAPIEGGEPQPLNSDMVTPSDIPAPAGTPPQPDTAPAPAAPEGMPPVPAGMEGSAPLANAPVAPAKGINHFRTRKLPYVLLATFTLGKQPVDITSNIGQNLANQDLINKRNRQIDKNADSMNQGLVVSLERSGLTKDEAKQVTEALRKGGTVVVPAGSPADAVMRLPTPGLPADVFNQLADTRNRVRDIWGIRGSSPAGVQSETTVRGKVIVGNLDTSRIGGGISQYLEQFAKHSYNWIAQLLYVYDDRFSGAIQSGAPIPRVKITVKPGSLLPKDPTTVANQGMELAGSGKMSLVDLYKALDKPNAEELAVNAWLEINAPEILYAKDPRVAQVVQMKQQQAQAAEQAKNAPPAPKSPIESINYKDLPPDGKVQLAGQAGIHLDPTSAVTHEMLQHMPATSGPAKPNTQ